MGSGGPGNRNAGVDSSAQKMRNEQDLSAGNAAAGGRGSFPGSSFDSSFKSKQPYHPHAH